MKPDKTTLQLLLVTIGILGLLVIINYDGRERSEGVPPPVVKDKADTAIPLDSNLTVYVSGNVCEGCHMSGKTFIPQAVTAKPHVEGGLYCLSCHNISHERHPVEGNVTCENCHGATPSMPVFVNGSIPCNNCHGYPDPLKPSYGNLITIHRDRGVACTKCHTDECSKCHASVGADEKWEKRLTHFRTIVRTGR